MSNVFSERISELIRASLVDGAISDKEREVIRREAVKEGVDPDMVDVMLDAELQKRSQARRKRQRLCPHCGAELEEFNTRCPACGEEIRDGRAASSVQVFSNHLEEIAGQITSAKARRKEMTTYISNFNVPNRREDLLEFLTLAAANSRREGGVSGTWKSRFFTVIGGSIVFWIALTYIITIGKEGRFHNFILDFFVAVTIAILFTSFTGLPIAIWYALKGGNDTMSEHNYLAPVWKKKFQAVMQQARATLTQPGDVTTLNHLEQQAGLKRKQ